MSRHPHLLASAAVLVVIGAAPSRLAAQDEDVELGWFDTAELSFVSTAGNSESSTLGLKNTLTRQWEKSKFRLLTKALRAESTTTTTLAIGDPDQFVIEESSNSELTAENFSVEARFDHHLREHLFWFLSSAWDRNEFSGIHNRYTSVGGIGIVHHDDEEWELATDYGVTYTRQEDVEPRGEAESFLGLRFSSTYRREITTSATLEGKLILDFNTDETDDFRSDATQSLKVSISERVAVKLTVQLLYDNVPSLQRVPLVANDRQTTLGSVQRPLDELDSVLTVALVIDL